MTIGTGNFAELLWPGIKSLVHNSYDDWEPVWTQIFDKVSSDKAFEKFQTVTGFDLAAVKAQGDSVSYMDTYMGWQPTITPVVYSIGVVVTREMYDDDLYNYISSLPKKLGRANRQTEEVVTHDILNNGFSGSQVMSGGDGQPLFSANHPLIGGGTYSNTLAVQSDLTQTSLEQMLINVRKMVDDRGRPIAAKGVKLVVPTDLDFVADKILKTEYEVGSADNTINPVKGMLKKVTSPYLTDTDAWFVTTNVDDGLIFTDRTKFELQRQNDFDTFNLKMATYRRFGVGWADARGVFGSSGA